MAADGVDLVDEDDGGGVLLGLVEQVAHARGAHADEHLDELGGGHGEEGHAGLAGDGLGQEGLTGSGRAVEEDALGDLGADGAELLGLGEELADLLELLDGLVLAGDVVEGDVGHLLGTDFRLGAAEAHGAAAPAAHATDEPPHEAAQQQGGDEQLDEGGPPAGGGHHGVEALLGGGGLHEAVDLLGLGVGVGELDLLAHRAGLDALLLGLDVGGGEVQLDALVAVDDGDRLDRVRLVPQERQAVGGVDGAVAEHRGEDGPAEDDDQKEGHQPQERVAQGVAELAVALAAVVLTGLARLPRVLAAGLAPRIFHRAVGPFNILIPQTLADSTAKVPLRLLTFAPGVAGRSGGVGAPRRRAPMSPALPTLPHRMPTPTWTHLAASPTLPRGRTFGPEDSAPEGSPRTRGRPTARRGSPPTTSGTATQVANDQDTRHRAITTAVGSDCLLLSVLDQQLLRSICAFLTCPTALSHHSNVRMVLTTARCDRYRSCCWRRGTASAALTIGAPAFSALFFVQCVAKIARKRPSHGPGPIKPSSKPEAITTSMPN